MEGRIFNLERKSKDIDKRLQRLEMTISSWYGR